MKFYKALIFLLLTVVLFSCKDDDMGETDSPTGRIYGQVKHHLDAIPNATVYIKYGTIELPGTNPSDYDDQVTVTGTEANYEFTGLEKGPYYLFGIGTDDACMCEVIGGVPIILDSDSDSKQSIVPVTE